MAIILNPMFKKGYPLQVSKYRGITRLDIEYRVLTAILIIPINLYTADIVGDYLGVFSKKKSIIYMYTYNQKILRK